ncbi:MAG: hypothetical protein ABIH23_14025, partial [bacterium]
VRKPLEEDDRKARLRRGKLNVRFDEGELEIGHSPLRQLSTLPISSDSASKLASPIPNRSTRRYA